MKENYSGHAISSLASITAWIVGPVLVGIFIGKILDQKYETEPWLSLISVGVCFLISIFGLIKKALKEFKQIENDSKNKEKE